MPDKPLNPEKAEVTVRFLVALDSENKIDLKDLALVPGKDTRFDVADDSEMKGVGEIVQWETVEVTPYDESVNATLVLIKPDAVRRNLVQAILGYVPLSLDLICMERFNVREDPRVRKKIERHYAEHKGRVYYDNLVAFMAGSPFYAVGLRSDNGGVGTPPFRLMRQMMGGFKPPREPGTIRGDMMHHDALPYENLVHGSDSEDNARRELNIWFPGKFC